VIRTPRPFLKVWAHPRSVRFRERGLSTLHEHVYRMDRLFLQPS
jgi:hypothetical protein